MSLVKIEVILLIYQSLGPYAEGRRSYVEMYDMKDVEVKDAVLSCGCFLFIYFFFL